MDEKQTEPDYKKNLRTHRWTKSGSGDRVKYECGACGVQLEHIAALQTCAAVEQNKHVEVKFDHCWDDWSRHGCDYCGATRNVDFDTWCDRAERFIAKEVEDKERDDRFEFKKMQDRIDRYFALLARYGHPEFSQWDWRRFGGHILFGKHQGDCSA